MSRNVIISVDLNGGSNAPESVIHGVAEYINSSHDVEFILYGVSELCEKFIADAKLPDNRYTFVSCDSYVSDDEQPIRALKTGRNSTMRRAIDAVGEKVADACVSCGNTGALMVMSKMSLRMLAGIKRPAICSVFPNLNGGSVMLDLGANSECDPINLYEFAIMGSCYARVVMKKQNPTIGILNVGHEEYKGRDIDKKAHEILKKSDLNYHGFIEGHDITEGTVDVVVTDGFTGNVVLKTAEGTSKFCQKLLKQAFVSTFFAKLGALLAKKSLKLTMSKFDPRNYNGAMFIGLDGIVVKSHGSSDAHSVANAIDAAVRLVRQGINEDIKAILETKPSTDENTESFVDRIKTRFGFKK